jgi:hypothetical protein
MENKFTYSNTLIKMKYYKIFAINAMNINVLLITFVVVIVASYRDR